MATKVSLRKKPISGNRQSLYLDFYPAIVNPKIPGKLTRREFLGLYLFVNPKDAVQKQNNSAKLAIANSIRHKRENELNKPEIYTGFEKEQLRIKELGEQDFIQYFSTLLGKRTGTNKGNWQSALKHLMDFTGDQIRFMDLNERFLEDFKYHLLNSRSHKSEKVLLARNSAVSYFNKVKAALKQAYREGYLRDDLNAKVGSIKPMETLKQTLTIEELNKLAKTESRSHLTKKAGLFSAMTGMPFMEMKKLEWGQVEASESFGYRIKMIRQKTGQPYVINISKQAYEMIGPPKKADEPVFGGLNNRDRYYYFQLWLATAGVTKKMTFHDLRHTYASLQADLDANPFVLQGNMGHSSITQTMVYARVSDSRKQADAEKIKLDL